MISFSKLLLGKSHYGDTLRYTPHAKGERKGTTSSMGPVVVWNCTRTCNLACRHCYAEAVLGDTPNELTTEEAKNFMDSLKSYRVPVLLFSGGEPLKRADLFELMAYGKEIGLRMVISTNGTLIDEKTAKRIKELGTSYVGISLDGLEDINDSFRGKKGAFVDTLQGFKNCHAVRQKTGLRLSLSRTTARDLPAIFDLIERESIKRVCFYHLVYSGRGAFIQHEDLNHEEMRRTIDYIIEKTLDFDRRGVDTEILTVDNHCDAIYIYQYLKKQNPKRAVEVWDLLSINGGNRSGMAIGSVDWEGNVYIDQFTRAIPLGNIRERSFGEIWDGKNNDFLQKLRNRKEYITGRCKECRWLSQCNGNFRARALSTGDVWASDPACYFTDEEIGLGGGI